MSEAKVDSMREALRSFALDCEGERAWCKVCESDWPITTSGVETHQPGCLAARKCGDWHGDSPECEFANAMMRSIEVECWGGSTSATGLILHILRRWQNLGVLEPREVSEWLRELGLWDEIDGAYDPTLSKSETGWTREWPTKLGWWWVFWDDRTPGFEYRRKIRPLLIGKEIKNNPISGDVWFYPMSETPPEPTKERAGDDV